MSGIPVKKAVLRIGLWVLFLFFGTVQNTEAAQEAPRAAPPGSVREEQEAAREDSYIEMWLDELQFDGLDDIVEQDLFPDLREKMTFSKLVEILLDEGLAGIDGELLLDWISDVFAYELSQSRSILVQVVFLAVIFSVLCNFAGAFRNGYVADLGFLLVYCVTAVLLLTSFSVFSDLVGAALGKSVDFMKVLVPTFCFSMVFSSGAYAAEGFYQMAFLVIYLIQWLFLEILVPLVHVYVLITLFNHFYEDEKFQNLEELMLTVIRWSMKTAATVVVGLNVVQGLILPAKDRLFGGTVGKAASAIPGIGNTIGSVGELMLGAGALIKSCIGAAALFVLLLIGLVPVLKILLLSLLYKLSAVVVEPVADKRFAGALRGMAEGGVLYLQLTVYSLALFFVTIALAAGASGMAG